MAPPGSRLFLERGSYRQRRVMDAIRLVVILGAGLWMIPLLWPSAGAPADQAMPLSRALQYVFGVWALLIATSYLLARGIRRLPETTGDTEDT